MTRDEMVEQARSWMACHFDIPIQNVPDDGRLEVMADFALTERGNADSLIYKQGFDAGYCNGLATREAEIEVALEKASAEAEDGGYNYRKIAKETIDAIRRHLGKESE